MRFGHQSIAVVQDVDTRLTKLNAIAAYRPPADGPRLSHRETAHRDYRNIKVINMIELGWQVCGQETHQSRVETHVVNPVFPKY